MKIKFDLLFEVVFEHEYFKDGLVSGLKVRPTSKTIDILRNFGLLFKRTERGFIILYEIDTANSAEPPLKPIISKERFSFELYMNDKYFTNYTYIPLDHKYPNFFYFNNLTENIVNSDLLLNIQNYTYTNDIVELASAIYNITEPTTNPSSLLTIKDLEGTTVFSKSIPSQNSNLIYQLDFSKISTGRYDIEIDGTPYKKIFTDQAISRKSLFGIIDIFNSSTVPSSYRFAASDGAVSKKIYKIRFSRRNTTWKYYVILKKINSDPGLFISYGANASGEEIYPNTMTFNKTGATEPELIKTYGLDKVFLFKSQDEIPLYEIPKTNIKLLKPDITDESEGGDADTEPDVVIDNLPNAPITAIKTDTTNTETFSEIFIYV